MNSAALDRLRELLTALESGAVGSSDSEVYFSFRDARLTAIQEHGHEPAESQLRALLRVDGRLAGVVDRSLSPAGVAPEASRALAELGWKSAVSNRHYLRIR